MKKKFLYFFFTIATVLCLGAFLSACGNKNTAKIEGIDNATINGKEIFMYISSDTDEVSLSDKVKCDKNSIWKLYYDNLGQTEIPTKIATGKNGKLQDGNNVFYIVVNSQDGRVTNTYQLTIHRSYAVQINYYDGNSILKTEWAYTGKEYFIEYTPTLTGYTFNGWKTNIEEIVNTITPWETTRLYTDKTPITFTTSLDVNGGNALSNSTITLKYGEHGTLSVPIRENYDFVGWFVDDKALTDNLGNILPNWTVSVPNVLIAHWQIKQFNVNLQTSDEKAGFCVGSGKYDYGSTATIEAFTFDGYNFMGWYDNDKMISSSSTYTFNVNTNINYIAKWNYFTLTTDRNIADAGTISNFNETKVSIGEKITLSAQTYIGYNWLGWYINNALISDEITFTFTMVDYNTCVIANWEIDDRLSNFTYTLTKNTCTITGIIDKTAEIIEVPDFVTSIRKGAFNGCSYLTSITLPFVGGYKSTTNTFAEISSFGYIFGTSNYEGAAATSQRHSTGSDGISVFYILISLKNVVLSSGNILYHAFENCTYLENVILPNDLTSIGDSAFYNCTNLKEIKIPKTTKNIGAFVFWKCTSLTSIEFEDTKNWYKSYSSTGYDGTAIDFTSSQDNVQILAPNNTSGVGYYYSKH